MERRVEEPDHHRFAIHRFEEVFEVVGLQFLQRVECGLGIIFEDYAAHHREPVAHEHVLGSGETYAVGSPTLPGAPGPSSALARTPRVRISSAQPRSVPSSALGSGSARGRSPR